MNKIKAERAMAGLSQEQLADKLGTRRDTIRAWETGARQVPSNAVRNMARLFGVTSDWLLGLSDTRNVSEGTP